jgi:predicted small secreted protein
MRFLPKPSRTICLVIVTGLLLGLTGCNTARGFGKDVEKTGEKIQQTTR